MNKSIIKKHQQKMAEDDLDSQLNRARSITVGTAFGGTTEVMMRRNNGEVVWCVLQPVEVMELIHQLSANVGCHINIIPRQDFGSWRDWRLTPEELAHYRGIQPLQGIGHAPHVNDMAPHANKGSVLPPPKLQPGLAISNNEENIITIEKPTKTRNKKIKSTSEINNSKQ